MSLSITEKIIKGINHGDDREVMSLLYKKLMPKLKKYILTNRGNEEDVKDLFQDSVFIIYRKVKMENYVPLGDLINYMFVICKNNWIKKAVKHQRNTSIEQHALDINDREEGALSVMISKEKHHAALAIMNTLGDQCAELLNLRIYEELELQEIADQMNFSNTNVVKSTIYRCKQKLKDKIKKNKGFQNLIGLQLP